MGDMVMKVIELETKRDALRKEELQVKLKTLGREEQEREQKKLRATEKKQDKLLFVCFHVLMNLAEDITIERKMKKRKITSLLVQVPQCCRTATDLAFVIGFPVVELYAIHRCCSGSRRSYCFSRSPSSKSYPSLRRTRTRCVRCVPPLNRCAAQNARTRPSIVASGCEVH
jgi:hypothetical protein